MECCQFSLASVLGCVTSGSMHAPLTTQFVYCRDPAMSVTDSEANFRARAQALGLENNLVEKFVSAGINSLAKFAFSSNYVPGAGEDTPFVDAIQTVLDRDASLGELATLRRLHHEAYAMSAAELKLSVERCDETGLKRLTQPERAERLKKQQTRLTGLRIVGRMEPADRLVDTAVSQYEENRLAYIELSKCICKEQEILAGSSRDDKQMAVDSSGIVRLRNKESKVDADLSTDLLLRQAFMRRALAYDQANVLGFLLHDQWIERLFESRVDCPPEGYAKISQQQVVNADRRLFVKLAELTRSGIQLTSAGRPVDLVFEDAMNHPDVLHLLQPLPSTRTSEKRATEPKNDDPRKLFKGKSKGKGKSIRMPQGLENGSPNTTNGQPVCFDHNFGKCSRPVTKGRCARGLHVCCYRGCFSAGHTYGNCDKNKGS